MFGIKKLRARLALLEHEVATARPTPELRITIPVVDKDGEYVKTRQFAFYPYEAHATFELSVQEAFDALQKALGVKITLEQGTKDSVQVYEG